jgi:hypothetical protein
MTEIQFALNVILMRLRARPRKSNGAVIEELKRAVAVEHVRISQGSWQERVAMAEELRRVATEGGNR